MRKAPIVAVLLAAAGPSRGAPLTADPAGGGKIFVNVRKTGLFSPFAHDHRMEVTRWRARAEVPDGDLAHATVEVTLDAASLQERNDALSAGDREEIEAETAGPKILDAARYPEIVFRADKVTLAAAAGDGPLRGTLEGTLALHGETRPLELAFEAERDGASWRVRGKVKLKQTEYGIRPFRTMGGTLGVKDAVEVELALTFRAAGTAAR